MQWYWRILILGLSSLLAGCGVVLGTFVDTGIGVATYPFKEYVFMGAYKYDNTWDKPYQHHPMDWERPPGQKLVGLAVSGGGSRSAYFTACVLAELAKMPVEPDASHSYLDEVDYISSVSGGSLVAAYYCLKRFQHQSRPCDQIFFPALKAAMRTNFEWRALLKLVLMGYWGMTLLTYYDRGDLMASVWDGLFFHNATFADLLRAQHHGAPTLIINGTNLSDGRRFVFTTVPDDCFNRSAYFQAIRQAGFIKYSATQQYVPFAVMGFQSLGCAIEPYRIAKAVVASAAVPNLLGPVTLKNYQRQQLIHIVDGGVYDNYGLESLMQLITAYLDRHPGMPAEIIVIDGSGYFQEDQQQSDQFTIAYYAQRPLEISWLRTKNYMEYVCQQARCFRNAQGVYPYRNLSFKLVSLYGLLPSQRPRQWLTNDPMLQKIMRPDLATKDLLQKITTIQTRFQISAEDCAMIAKVAAEVVRQSIGSPAQRFVPGGAPAGCPAGR